MLNVYAFRVLAFEKLVKTACKVAFVSVYVHFSFCVQVQPQNESQLASSLWGLYIYFY